MDDINQPPDDEREPESGDISTDGGALPTPGDLAISGDGDEGDEDIAFMDLDGGSPESRIETGTHSGTAPVWLSPLLPGLESLGVPPGLILSDKQHEHVSMLTRMLETEDAPKPRSRQRRDHMAGFWQHLIRYGTAAFLLVVVTLNLAHNAPALPEPQISAETRQALVQVERLEKGDALLVAFDYQPGFAAEVEQAATPLLEKIAGRGARLQAISTLPLGPLLAEHFWKSKPWVSSAPTNMLIHNLGYLPGGSLGLAQLGAAFKGQQRNRSASAGQAASIGGRNPFLDPADLAGTRLVIVLTEDAQKGRDWIEQVQTDRSDIPLMIVTSAQAAPILRPYLVTEKGGRGVKQITGLVSGMPGGLSLHDDTQPDPTDGRRWNAYAMSTLVAGSTILGALVIGQLNLRRRKHLHRQAGRRARL